MKLNKILQDKTTEQYRLFVLYELTNNINGVIKRVSQSGNDERRLEYVDFCVTNKIDINQTIWDYFCLYFDDLDHPIWNKLKKIKRSSETIDPSYKIDVSNLEPSSYKNKMLIACNGTDEQRLTLLEDETKEVREAASNFGDASMRFLSYNFEQAHALNKFANSMMKK